MPELLRLLTPDFEFSVWATDISARSRTYQATLAKRDDCEAVAEVRFSPAQFVRVEKPQTAVINSEHRIYDAGNARITDAKGSGEAAIITLNKPLFFENTQYQFEWIFFEPIARASLGHRSQILNDAFRFSEKRGPVPARLTGTINTGNDVGWMRLPLHFEHNSNTYTQHISFEVLPTKMALHQDLHAMYLAIDSTFPLWRFSLVEKTEKDAAQGEIRGHFPLMWLANFSQLRMSFEKGLKAICAAPHSRLQPTVASMKAAKLKGRLPYKLGEKIKQDFANAQYDKRYCVEKKRLSVDTPENRFIKMATTKCKKQLAEFEERLRSSNQTSDRQRFSDAFLNELHGWQQPLGKILNQSFLKDVGGYSGLNRESLVLQQKTGYSAVYRVWQELKFYLDVFSSQASISMKSVAEIYEVWCFICLKQILEEGLGFELVTNNQAKLSLNSFFEYQLTDGFAGAFEFKRVDGVVARLAHEPKFTKKGRLIRSFLVNQEPDIVLEVTLPSVGNGQEQKQFIWLFDAKYRIKTDRNRFDDEDIDSTDYVPDDAINQMHRYRDALIRLSSSEYEKELDKRHAKSRPVFGAFALYPGLFDQVNEVNPYSDAIKEIGIGAFALLPSGLGKHSVQEEQANPLGLKMYGCTWLLEFLQAQIGGNPSKETAYPINGMAERLYVQDAARIPYYGMRQVLYPDLAMTVSLAGQCGRSNAYFEAFENGTAQWYHLPQKTFVDKFKQHISEEIRYLALASTSDANSSTKKIDKIWPVKRVSLLPRHAITEQQAGKNTGSDELYYLFELGRPLTLQHAVTHVPHRPMKNSMKLTTLTRLESVGKFSDVEKVYEDALV